jgi:hypothetical protein
MTTLDIEAEGPYFSLHDRGIDFHGPPSYEGAWFDWTNPRRLPETDIETLATASWEGI